MNNNYVSAIITAAGIGARMGSDIPKLELKLDNARIIDMTVDTFVKISWIDEIILVTSEQLLDEYKSRYNDPKIKVVLGSDTRERSTYQGLLAVSSCSDYTITHDGARPYVTEDIIASAYKNAQKTGATITAVPATDTIKVVEDGYVRRTLDRSTLYNIQTPQVFKTSWIKEGYYRYLDKIVATDDSSFIEAMDKEVSITMGSYSNIKITTKEDLKR